MVAAMRTEANSVRRANPALADMFEERAARRELQVRRELRERHERQIEEDSEFFFDRVRRDQQGVRPMDFTTSTQTYTAQLSPGERVGFYPPSDGPGVVLQSGDTLEMTYTINIE